MYRASSRDLLSFSKPKDLILAISFSVASVGIPSLNTRTFVLLMMLVSLLLLLPIISLLNTPAISQFSFFALSAINVEPRSPCSSPLTATKIIVAVKECLLMILAHSITAAVPLPSSLAPGASPVLSITSVRLVSKWPLMIKILLSLGSVPFRVATTFPKRTGTSTRLPSAAIVVVSIIADNLPFEFFANSLNFLSTQFLAAPIPFVLLLCVLNVFLVPNETKLLIYD